MGAKNPGNTRKRIFPGRSQGKAGNPPVPAQTKGHKTPSAIRICLCEQFSEYASRQYLSLSFRFYPQYSTAKGFLQEEISFLVIFDIFLIYD